MEGGKDRENVHHLWKNFLKLQLFLFKAAAFLTATLYPGIVFGIGFFVNLFIWGKHSSGAIPFTTMLAVAAMWFGISLPLVYLGYYFGYRLHKQLVLIEFN